MIVFKQTNTHKTITKNKNKNFSLTMTDYKSLYEESQKENSILRDLLQNRMPMGCIAETTYQPILDENENLKHERDFYIQRLKDVSSENTCPIIKELKERCEYLEKLKEEFDESFCDKCGFSDCNPNSWAHCECSSSDKE